MNILFKPNPYNINKHSMIYKDESDIEWIIVATDGSEDEGKAAGAYTYGLNQADVRIVSPIHNHSFFSELMTITMVLSEAPIEKNILVITDCLGTIDIILNKKWKKKEIASSFEYHLVSYARNFIIQRMRLHQNRVKFDWLPSHLDKLDFNLKCNEKKVNQLKQMTKKYGEKLMEKIIKMNELCDRSSKIARSVPNYDFLRNNHFSRNITINNELDIPLSKKEVGERISTRIILENNNIYFKNKEILNDFEPELTMESTPRNLKLISCKIHNGQMKTGNYVNTRLKSSSKRSYYDMTKTIFNPSEYCEDEECVKKLGTRLETMEHLLEYCENKELSELRHKKRKMINKLLNEKSDKKGNILYEKNNEIVELNQTNNEKSILFSPNITITLNNNTTNKNFMNKSGEKIENNFRSHEAMKLIILKDLGFTTDKNIQIRKNFINKRKMEKKNARDFYNREYKNENRCWISKREHEIIKLNNPNNKNRKGILEAITTIRLSTARDINNIYTRNKFNRRREEGINIKKVLYPLAVREK